KAGRPELQSHLQPYMEFEVSLSYRRQCLKKDNSFSQVTKHVGYRHMNVVAGAWGGVELAENGNTSIRSIRFSSGSP
ncbi:hypothetical protein ACQP3D_30335, partial [Escherichia coli]